MIKKSNLLWDNKLIRMSVICVGVWFFFRFLFTLVAPFILAFLLITLCYPLLERIQKRIPVKRNFSRLALSFRFFCW